MLKTVKEIADNIAPCGFICGLCIKFINGRCKGCGTNNEVCPILDCCRERAIRGCWECGDFPCCECNFRGVRIRAFLQCAKTEGTCRLAEYLLRNMEKGVRYHYDYTYLGDYDGFQNEKEVLEVLRNGKSNHVNVYERCPVYETDTFILRLVAESDAEELLKCYSNADAIRFFNSDNCDYGFHYESLNDMKDCIRRWINEYENRSFVRFTVIDKNIGKAVGTIEMFARAETDKQYGKVGVLRIDLHPDYERKHYIMQILEIVLSKFYNTFHVDHIITKAIKEAEERRKALTARGFSYLESNRIIPFNDYFLR